MRRKTMDKVLFITTRNVFNTCGELRLIKNRARALYDNWSIVTDMIAACSNVKYMGRNEEMGLGSRVIPVIFNASNPLSIIVSFFKLRSAIKEQLQPGVYKCLVLSGTATLFCLDYIRRLDKHVKVIADIHGSDEDILEQAKDQSLLRHIRQRIMYSVARWEQIKYLPRVDAMFVVSNRLVEYIRDVYHIRDPKCYIVPCAMDDNAMNPELLQKYRKHYRQKYRIDEDVILFVYSGGVSTWQCIDKSIELFNDIRQNCKRKCKMLLLSHKVDEIMYLIDNTSDILAEKATAEEVKRIMCAGDYAFLIREDNVTNNVAYPNKFLEYVQSGMKVITTPFVYDVAVQVEKYGVGILIDLSKDNKQELYDYINAEHVNDYGNRLKLLNNTAFGATMRKFVEECYQ